MSDPQPAPGKHVPARAEPVQPDNPGRSDESGSPASIDSDNAAVTAAEGQSGAKDRPTAGESQEENAIKNTTEGYK